MMHISRPGPPPTIAELIEALQKLPPDMRCTNVLTEWEPQLFRHVPLATQTAKFKASVQQVSKITITLEPWAPEIQA